MHPRNKSLSMMYPGCNAHDITDVPFYTLYLYMLCYLHMYIDIFRVYLVSACTTVGHDNRSPAPKKDEERMKNQF